MNLHEEQGGDAGSSIESGALDRAAPFGVAARDLRRRCDPSSLGIASTADVKPLHGVFGQDDAVEALRFGLEIDARGQNVYVRGLTGTRRLALVQRLLEDVQPPCQPAQDRCYVRNFEDPNLPILITLARGCGKAFQARIDELIAFIGSGLVPQLQSESMKARRKELEQKLEQEMQRLGAPFEKDLAENDLTMVMLQVPGGVQPAILPLIEGEPAPPDKIQELLTEKKLDRAKVDSLREKVAKFGERLGDLNEELSQAREAHRTAMRTLIEEEATQLLDFSVREIKTRFPGEGVARFLDGIVRDVVENQLKALGEGRDLARLYRVNLLLSHEDGNDCPILTETQPTLQNLLGTIDRQVLPGGGVYSDHLMIHAGSLLRADGGFLVLEARDVLSEPGAWRVLVRTLRTGKLEIRPQESLLFGSSAVLQPEPIPVKLKVVLIGEPHLYDMLDAADPDFPQLFKVLADFDTSLPRNADSGRYYAGRLAALAEDEGLPHFDAGAVAALVEHGARVAGRRDRLTTRTGRLSDIAREAAFLANKAGEELVGAERVNEAVRRNKRRGDLPARKFREAIAEGTIRVQTEGAVVGQVNGLAVTHAGPLTYGFPARITATIGPGHAGAINIEREAQLSGAIHTKGFYILGGLLRHLMRGSPHALAFSASIAFEQSYGGIDGDSASGAEICCLLSALTGIPLRQGVAMTGSIDQLGRIQPIGAASEKIEGFFDVCVDAGLTGDQGVILPAANEQDLMLRQDVVDACAAGRFHVWAVETIHQALEIFTGLEAGELDDELNYPEESILGRAARRARQYWSIVSASGAPTPEEREGEDDEAEEPEDAEA